MSHCFSFTIEESEICPGTVGFLIEDQPKLTTAHVRPFVWSILLFRGGVQSWEVVNALSSVCSVEDMKVNDEEDDERTWAEICVDNVLGEMLIEGLLDYSQEKDVWVLRYSPKAVPVVIKAVSGINGSIPKHFTLEMSKGDPEVRRSDL